jgi:hypothetical protein
MSCEWRKSLSPFFYKTLFRAHLTGYAFWMHIFSDIAHRSAFGASSFYDILSGLGKNGWKNKVLKHRGRGVGGLLPTVCDVAFFFFKIFSIVCKFFSAVRLELFANTGLLVLGILGKSLPFIGTSPFFREKFPFHLPYHFLRSLYTLVRFSLRDEGSS